MKYQNIFCFFLISLIWLPGVLRAGTTGSLSGTVRDADSGSPLWGAIVLVQNTTLGTQTEEKGNFFIHNIPAGIYKVEVQLIGYEKKIISGVQISPDANRKLDIRLQGKAVEGDAVVVEAERPVITKEITASQYVVERKRIESMPVSTVDQVLETQAGVVEGGHIRGGRSEEVIYLIDGIPLNQSINGGLGSYLPVEAIQEMTVLTGGWDPEFGNASSGVVNIITRRPSDEFEGSIKYENDHLFGGNRDNRLQRAAFTVSGPLWNQRLSAFAVGVLQHDDTRYWWDFENRNEPLHHRYGLLTNLTYNLPAGRSLGLQLLASDESTRDYDFAWRYNLNGLPETGQRSYRAVLNYSHNFSAKTYLNARFSYYHLKDWINDNSSEQVAGMQPFSYDFFLLYVLEGNRQWWKRSTEKITSIRTDLTTYHFLNQYVRMGFDFNYFDIQQDMLKFEPQRTVWGKPIEDEPLLNYSNYFNYQPYNGAVYLQTKWETPEKSLINLGVRYDFLDPRAQVPTVTIPTQGFEFTDEQVKWSKASIKHQISPRVGFGMPVLEHSFLFINYGLFFQTPLFEYFYTGLNSDFRFSQRALIGNPDLPPMKSKIFEVSYRQTFEKDYAFIVTGSVKKTTNLVDVSTFVGYDSKIDKNRGYGQFVTAPFANAQTFEIVLKKRASGFFWGEFNYTYSVAKAVSDHANSAYEYLQWGFQPDYNLYPVSWDQRHTLNLNLNFRYKKWLNANIISRFATPRPYTYFPSAGRNGFVPQGSEIRFSPNNARMKENYLTDLKVQLNLSELLKRQIVLPGQLSLFADVRNLFNNENVLWISADGSIGGELNDPSAYSTGQRIRLGAEYQF
ncbi:MAG: TonB-dependent receptor [Calditrichia bacterium]